jgi:hypothetical protein
MSEALFVPGFRRGPLGWNGDSHARLEALPCCDNKGSAVMMNDTECNETFGELTEIVHSSGLGWIIEQVKDEIRVGRNIDEETVQGFSSDEEPRLFPFDPGSEYLKAGPRAKFPVVREYSACERVILLIEAIDRAVADTAQMEAEVLTRLSSPEIKDAGLGVADDDQELIATIDRTSVLERAKTAAKLKSLLKELIKEVSN